MFLVGVALALLAFVAMITFGVILANRSGPGNSVPVVAAARDIDAREPLTLGMLTVTYMPQAYVPHGTFARLSDVQGLSAVVPIFKGEPLTANLVASDPNQIAAGGLAFLPIPEGYIAITVPTSELQGVAGYVTPGDYINIIATANSDLFFSKPSRLTTRTVFTNLRVIRVGPPSTAPKQGQSFGLAGSLTVILSTCDAQYLEWLITNVTLKYDLLSPTDYQSSAYDHPNAACPAASSPATVGPAAVDARWGFTKG